MSAFPQTSSKSQVCLRSTDMKNHARLKNAVLRSLELMLNISIDEDAISMPSGCTMSRRSCFSFGYSYVLLEV